MTQSTAELVEQWSGLRDRAEALPEDAPNLDLFADIIDLANEIMEVQREVIEAQQAQIKRLVEAPDAERRNQSRSWPQYAPAPPSRR